METLTRYTVRPVTTAVGAVVDGIDLRAELSEETVAFIRTTLHDRGVVFFRGQDLSNDEMHAFVSYLGVPVPEPFADAAMQGGAAPVSQSNMTRTRNVTAVWHSDTTFVPNPPMLTALRAVKLPPVGGDTLWASMYAAYEALSEPLRRMLDGLTAVHSIAPVMQRMGKLVDQRASSAGIFGAENIHPVVLVHPETGRKALFVNEGWTTRIVELDGWESARILALLFEHVKSPQFNLRWTWQPNDLALWDNRTVQHFAVPDYDAERIMQRVVLAGEELRGPQV